MNIGEIYIKEEQLELLRLLAEKDFKKTKLQILDAEAGKSFYKSSHTIHGWRKNLMKIFKVNSTQKMIKKAKDIGLILLAFLFYVSGFSQTNCIMGTKTEWSHVGDYPCTPFPFCARTKRIEIFLYARDSACFPAAITAKFWNNDDSSYIGTRYQLLADILPVLTDTISCLANQNVGMVLKARYGITYDFFLNVNGFTATCQGCCRESGYTNIADGAGWTCTTQIPPIFIVDHSPYFIM